MKKYLSMAAIAMTLLAALYVAPVSVAGDYYPFSLTVAAGDTNKVQTVDLFKKGGLYSASVVDHIEFAVTSGTATGAVQVVMYDLGVASTSLASTAVPAVATQYTVFPTRTWTGSATNTVQESYIVRSVRVTVQQPAGASASTWEGAIITK